MQCEPDRSISATVGWEYVNGFTGQQHERLEKTPKGLWFQRFHELLLNNVTEITDTFCAFIANKNKSSGKYYWLKNISNI